MDTFGAVIPAYNEANNLAGVLRAICEIDWLAQIVVVDDGSQDDTSTVARQFALPHRRVSVIRLPKNQGKGAAMMAGANALQTEFVIFLDADLIGLQPHHLEQLRQTLLQGQNDMTIAVFREGRKLVDASHRLAPALSGQRCLHRQAAIQSLAFLTGSRYGVETGLTYYARKNKWHCHYVAWHGVTHVMKERKLGWLKGLHSRWRMYTQILLTILLIIGVTRYLWKQPAQKRRRLIWRVATVTGLAIAIFWFTGFRQVQAYTELRLHDLESFQPANYQRILVFAPHPDDEVLASGGVIGSVLAANPPAQVRVVVVTNGDASFSTALLNGYNPVSKSSYQKLARARQQESLQALTALGLDEKQIQFWGFPDRGLDVIWRSHWTGDQPYRSDYTGLSRTVTTLRSPTDIPYTGSALLEQIRLVLDSFQPDAVIMPHPSDAHPDHRALAYLITLAIALNRLEGQSSPPQMFAYVMWLSNIPRPVSIRLDKDLQELPERFPANTDEWFRFSLASNIRQHKISALKAYRSQQSSLKTLMRSAGSGTELFNQLLEHNVPRLSTPAAPWPNEQWWSITYQNEWVAVPGSSSLGIKPQSLWAMADSSKLWLATRLSRPPRLGIEYTFVLRTVQNGDTLEIPLTANNIVKTPDNNVYVMAQLPLEHIAPNQTGQVFMMSLQTRMPGHIALMRSEWHILYVQGND